MEMIRANFGSNSKDFITAVDENNVIVVKDLSEGDAGKEIEKTAKSAESVLVKEGMHGVRISYGTIVNEIKDDKQLPRCLRNVQAVFKKFVNRRQRLFIEIVRAFPSEYFFNEHFAKRYRQLVNQTSNPQFAICHNIPFVKENLPYIQSHLRFFVRAAHIFNFVYNRETSRQLFIHRNTLVYRLDKLQKSTGLDLRVFEDAITFKIALMVVKYMKYMETFEY